jgi:hypothetical protein
LRIKTICSSETLFPAIKLKKQTVQLNSNKSGNFTLEEQFAAISHLAQRLPLWQASPPTPDGSLENQDSTNTVELHVPWI